MDSRMMIPRLESVTATESERKVAAEFTRYRMGESGEWNVYFQVRHQRFEVATHASHDGSESDADRRLRAEWYCWQLAKALMNARVSLTPADTPPQSAPSVGPSGRLLL